MGWREGALWIGGWGLLLVSMSQPPTLRSWLLRHSCCPFTLSSHSAFCTDPWPLLRGTRWTLRQGCSGNWQQFLPSSSSCRELRLLHVAAFFFSQSTTSRLPWFRTLEALMHRSLRHACVQVGCYLLNFRCSPLIVISREEIHASDITPALIYIVLLSLFFLINLSRALSVLLVFQRTNFWHCWYFRFTFVSYLINFSLLFLPFTSFGSILLFC